MSTSSRFARKCALAVTITVALGACASSPNPSPTSESEKLNVVAAFYPLEFLADRIGETDVNVIPLTSGGVEAHDVELSPRQVAEIHDADLVLYVKGFQPAVDEAVAQEAPSTSIDLGAGLETLTRTSEGGKSTPDPHIWLDPQNMVKMADVVSTRLSDLAPKKQQDFETHNDRLTGHLESLDTTWTKGTATCESRRLIVSHEAFGYLAQQYEFEQIGVSGLTPDSEPSPTRIAEMSDLAKADDVTTIYFETTVDPQVAVTIAEEAGITTAVLDPLESRSPEESGDYLSVMLQNLDRVKDGQRCS